MTEGVTAYAPGSASNLGPGFDCLGVAFTGMGDRVHARRCGSPGVRVASVSDPRIPTDPARNSAAIAAAKAVERAGRLGSLELRIEKGLPLAAGMGGSAASAVAGAVAANALMGLGLSREELMAAALDAEAVVAGRHPDNVAPSLYGGAVLAVGDPPRLARLRAHPSLRFVLVTPDYQVETARARAVLPREVPRADAIGQAGRLARLVLGLERGEAELIRGSMEDAIAEPARMPLYPGYPEARAAGLEAGAMGVAVSGAGPTILALTTEASGPAVGVAMADAYRRLEIEARVHFASVDEQGARLVTGAAEEGRP